MYTSFEEAKRHCYPYRDDGQKDPDYSRYPGFILCLAEEFSLVHDMPNPGKNPKTYIYPIGDGFSRLGSDQRVSFLGIVKLLEGAFCFRMGRRLRGFREFWTSCLLFSGH